MRQFLSMKRAFLFLALAVTAKAGDTFDCINSRCDYINYAPPSSSNAPIVVAYDSKQYDPRWVPMLDPNDLRRLIFIRARNAREERVFFAR